MLVNFRNPEAMAKALIQLMGDPVRRNKIRKTAYEYGRNMVWREVGRQYVEMFLQVLGDRKNSDVKSVWKQKMLSLATIPEIKLDHLKFLSDDVGLLQHARFGIADRYYGYSADDVGRGLAAIMTYYNQQKDEQVLPLIHTYMSFLLHAQTGTGQFHNFMSYDRKFLDNQGGEDTMGQSFFGVG